MQMLLTTNACALVLLLFLQFSLLVTHIPEYDRHVILHQSVIAMSHSLGCGYHVTFLSFLTWSPGSIWLYKLLGNSLLLRIELVPIQDSRVYFP